jgi:hypothetical protein
MLYYSILPAVGRDGEGGKGEWKVLLGFEKVLGGMGVYFFR